MNDTVIIFCAFLGAGLSCGQTVWVCNTMHKPGRLYAASIFQRLILHLLIRLNRMVIPTVSATSSRSHSSPTPTELTLPTPPMSSSLHLVACPDYLAVQKPVKAYSKLFITASKTKRQP
jgi:hypothetical protein